MEQDGCERTCWICLGDESLPGNELCSHCRCPSRFSHAACLARWSLRQAGRREEKNCRFCYAELPDYKATLQSVFPSLPMLGERPHINVYHGDQVFRIPLHPGENGRRQFELDVKRKLGMQEDVEIKAEFDCPDPMNLGSTFKLSGFAGTWDAVVFCAALSAARKVAEEKVQEPSSGTRTGFCGALSKTLFSRLLCCAWKK